jgi:uncharacterized protein
MRLVTLVLSSLALLCSGCITQKIGPDDFFSRTPARWPAEKYDDSYRTENMEIRHADGNVSQGFHLFSPNAKVAVLYFPGNGEVIDKEASIRIWQFRKLGVDAYLFDRRGHGRTGGKASLELVAADALQIFDEVRKKSSKPLIVHGFSLGGSVAGNVAANRAVDALVLEGSVTNAHEVLADKMPWYAKPFINIDLAEGLRQADNLVVVEKYKGPLLIAAGERDTEVPPIMSKRLYERSSSKSKRLEIIPATGHFALITAKGFEIYQSFIKQVAAN